MNNHKMIVIRKETDVELNKIRHEGQSYDGVIRELIKKELVV